MWDYVAMRLLGDFFFRVYAEDGCIRPVKFERPGSCLGIR